MAVKFVQNDTGSTLEVTCKDDAASTAINLTGATVKVKYRIDGGALQTKTMTLDAVPTTGKATYKWLTSELATGRMTGEIEITDSGGKILTSLQTFSLDVRARL